MVHCFLDIMSSISAMFSLFSQAENRLYYNTMQENE